MKKFTLMLLAGITMHSIAHSQATTRQVSTSAAATALSANQLATQQQMSAQRQAPPVSTLSIFPNFGWSNKPALPAGRWATAPVFSKNCISGTDTGMIYLIAGYDASFANTAINTIYNTTTGLYRNGAPIPAVRGQVAPIKVGTKIYVIGGYGASSFVPVGTNSIYDIASNTWTTGAAMPVPVGDYASGVYKDSLIYYVGGYNGSGDANNVQIYNTFSNTWSVGTAAIGTAVAGCRMGISGNKIVFVGGYSQTLAAELASAYQGVINPANPNLITWSALPNYPGGTVGRLAGGVSFENDGKIYFGGGDPDGQGISTLSTIFAYNTTTSAWDAGPNMPVSVSNIVSLAGIVNNDSLYLVTMGGYNGSIITTTHSWLNLGHAAPLPVAQADVAICSGSSTTLTASNALTYSWSPATNLSSTTTASTIANPSSTITYSVTMTKAYGCPIVDPVTVTVNPLPSVIATSTAAAVCSGSSVTLSGFGTATSYSWTGGVTDGVAFTPSSTLTYTVTGTDVNGCTNTDMTTVTVNPLPTVTANSTAAAVCAGTSVTLTASGNALSYSWDNSVTDGVAFVPTSTTTYMVTGTDFNGCTNTDMTTVTVNPLPTVTANSTAAAVCAGTSVTLTGSGTATSYSWDNSVTDGVSFVPTATTTYMVTGTDGNGCTNTDMTTVTVNPLPVVDLGPDVTQCSGTVMLDAGNAGSTYLWNDASVQQVLVASSTGTYSVTVTDGNGCSNSDAIVVTINANPVVNLGSNITQCGGTVNLDAGNPGATYIWSTSATTQMITVSSSGTYYVTATLTGGCNASDTIVVTIHALPTVTGTAASSTVCLNDANVTLTGTPAGGTWSGTGVSGTSFNPMTAGVGAHTATYTFTDANNCSNTAPANIQVNSCVGIIESSNAAGINVYPNPTNGSTTIVGDFSNSGIISISLFNVLGESVMAIENNAAIGVYSKTIDLNNLSAGIYYLQITENGNVISTNKIIKQ